MQRSRPAYTLMEIMAVLGILVIVGALTVPVVSSMFSSGRVQAAADAVRAQLTKTRNRAMEEHRPYRFAIKQNTGKYKIAPDSADYWSDAPANTDPPAAGDQQPLQVEGDLPEKVVFSSSSGGQDADDWHTVAVFMSDGSASNDVEISLAMEGSQQPVTLRLQASTGSVTTAALKSTDSEY